MISKKLSVSLILLYLGAAMVGLGVAYSWGIFASKSTPTPTASSPYALTLVETMNPWNTTVQQPAFYILATNGLQLATTISMPAHRMIQLTIISYDMPTPGSTDQQGQVTGTVGGNMYLMNGTIATTGMTAWGRNVTSVPGNSVAHTLEVPSLGINIPVVGGSTVVAYLYFDKAGTYYWLCPTPCGFGSGGMMGAMATSGWMEGQVIVS